MLKTPPMQTATATIDNYCSRLQSATLLEDRRAAIEGLRSVAKQYPASVASGSLRELIVTLRRDGLGDTTRRKDGSEEGGDVDTIRLVLETLLRLFEPDADSPEAGEEIALFMADEFCMRQENISLLLNLLDPTAPYSDNLSCKLSVQIMAAICQSRPDRLQESILNAPLGVSRLVGVLDNQRDDVRYAGLELLTSLTSGANEELRKLVAFDDVFGRVFTLIRLEGGLAEARIVVQDCLTLLINLIKGSASNQTMFRESGCISQFSALLKEAFPPAEPEAPFVSENRIRGGWGLLQLLRQLLVPDEPSTPQNQAAFSRAGLAQTLVDLAFHTDVPPMVQATALLAVADLIRNNAPIQVNFAQTQVRTTSIKEEATQVNGTHSKASSIRGSARPSVERQPTYIIEALLGLMLQQQRTQYELRTAACTVIQAYLAGHLEIRGHFMQRAIAGYKESEDAPNVLSSLLAHDVNDNVSVILSGWTVQDLVAQNRDAKTAFAVVQESRTNEDEDVLTAVPLLGARLQQSIQQNAEVSLIAAYTTTICVLLWDFADGINDFLAEGSSVIQTLLDGTKSESAVVAGLTATLLGIIYEFSTKDSPIPRKTLSGLLLQRLGRDKYLTALSALRSDPAIRDYDLPLTETDRLELSESFFNLFLTEYPRLRRAVDKDPGIEVLPYAAAEAGVQRDVLDDLRQKISALEASLSQSQQDAAQSAQQAQQDKLQMEQSLAAAQKAAEQEKVNMQKDLRSAAAESDRIRAVITKMQASHDDDTRKTQQQRQRDLEEANVKHARELATLRQDMDRRVQQAKQQAEQGFLPVRQDYERRLAELGNAHRTEQSGHATARTQLEALNARHSQVEKQASESSKQLQEISTKHIEAEKTSQRLQTLVTQLETDLAASRGSVEASEKRTETLKAQITELKDELTGKEQELATERAGYADLEQEVESERSKAAALSETIADLEKQLEEAKSSSTSSKKENSTAKADKKLLDNLNAEVARLKADAESAKKQQSAHEEELAASKKSADESKEAEKSAREELDNLLLVLADIEAKRDEYRTKVKDLGGEVTDDDDEDEEESVNDDVD